MSKVHGGNYQETQNLPPNGAGVTPNATAHTKGSWQELIASTSQDWQGFYVSIQRGVQTTTGEYLVDIALGAASSEQVIIPNMRMTGTSAALGDIGATYWCPVKVPAGSRVAARCQFSAASGPAIRVHTTGYGPHPHVPLYNTADSYGTSTSTSKGVAQAASSGSKSSWAQLVASTTNPIYMCYVMVGTDDVTSRTSDSYMMDIGVGANPNEVALIKDVYVRGNSAEGITILHGPYFVNVPSGTRLSLRAQTSSGATNIDVSVLAFS